MTIEEIYAATKMTPEEMADTFDKFQHFMTYLKSDVEQELIHASVFDDLIANGIPREIAYGDNKHLVPLPNQKNDYSL